MNRFKLFVARDLTDLRVDVTLSGPASTRRAKLVLDTGASATTLTPKLANWLGYSAADGYRPCSVTTAIGVEYGYWVKVTELTALGVSTPFAVQVFPLGHAHIDGLLGMNFLRHFNFEVRPRERVILAELAAR